MANLDHELDALHKQRNEQARARLDQLENRLLLLRRLLEQARKDKARRLASMDSVAGSTLQE